MTLPRTDLFKLLSATTLFFGSVVGADYVTSNTPNDSQIIQIVMAANNEEIATSQLLEKSNNRALKALATGMIKDHSNSNVEMKKLAKNLGLEIKDSGVSENIQKDARTEVTELNKLNGAKFDKGYIDGLVADHEALIKTFDKTLIPSAKNIQLAELLKKTRAVVQHHLTMAQQIQPTIDE
jgi:putative membrane protein